MLTGLLAMLTQRALDLVAVRVLLELLENLHELPLHRQGGPSLKLKISSAVFKRSNIFGPFVRCCD